jgi:hypothetical protein
MMGYKISLSPGSRFKLGNGEYVAQESEFPTGCQGCAFEHTEDNSQCNYFDCSKMIYKKLERKFCVTVQDYKGEITEHTVFASSTEDAIRENLELAKGMEIITFEDMLELSPTSELYSARDYDE